MIQEVHPSPLLRFLKYSDFYSQTSTFQFTDTDIASHKKIYIKMAMFSKSNMAVVATIKPKMT